MLKINCILEQASALPEVIQLVKRKAHELNSKKKSARVEDVYRELKDDGVEIDAESIALAYKNVPGIMGRKNFSTQADVNRFGGESLKKAIRIANEGDIVKSRMGRESVSRSVASGLASTFSTLEGMNDVDQSRLVNLKETISRAVNGMLDKSAAKSPTKLSFKEVLGLAFDAEDIGATGTEAMNGKVKSTFSTIDKIWDEVKDDIKAISAGIKDKPQRARFDQMVAEVVNSSYDLLLGTQQADDVVKDILKSAGYTKTINVKGNPTQVVDWNKALSNQADWKNDFGIVLRREGFTINQTQRVINRLEKSYNKISQAQAESALKRIKKNNNLNGNINKDALTRLVNLKNAGVFAPNNKAFLTQAMGFDLPQDVIDAVAEVIDSYDKNIKNSGGISVSNVYAEEVKRTINNLVSPLNKSGMEKFVQVFTDYTALRSASTISTIFNTFQNLTSGLNAFFIPTLRVIATTRNPKLAIHFMDQWFATIRDVSLGGVSPRDAKTVNLNQFENMGGLSDRWTYDNADSFFGYAKAMINALGQVTATAADAANGTVIYDAVMVSEAKTALRNKGMSGSEANKVIEDIIFGQHSSGISNAQFWYNEAKNMLGKQSGVVDRGTKAKRIAAELKWTDLINHGISIENIKAMQSAALGQKSRNLGHQSDVFLSPAFLVEAGSSYFSNRAQKAKEEGNQNGFTSALAAGSIFKAVNMFVGGKANWAFLTLQNSPFGVALGLFDIAKAEAFSRKEKPLYRQPLDFNDSEKLEQQLRERNKLTARFERGIIGTAWQSLLYLGFSALFSGAGDDDERKKKIRDKFEKYMQDPKTKRMMDKVAPMMLNAELQFAYDKKKNELDENRISNSFLLPYYMYKPEAMADYYGANISASTGFDYLKQSIGYNGRIKDEDERHAANHEAIAQYAGSLVGLPYTAWWDVVTDEVTVFENGFAPDSNAWDIRKEKFSIQKDNIDGVLSAFMNGFVTPDIYQGKNPERKEK